MICWKVEQRWQIDERVVVELFDQISIEIYKFHRVDIAEHARRDSLNFVFRQIKFPQLFHMTKVTKFQKSQLRLGDGNCLQVDESRAEMFRHVTEIRIVGVKCQNIADGRSGWRFVDVDDSCVACNRNELLCVACKSEYVNRFHWILCTCCAHVYSPIALRILIPTDQRHFFDFVVDFLPVNDEKREEIVEFRPHGFARRRLITTVCVIRAIRTNQLRLSMSKGLSVH